MDDLRVLSLGQAASLACLLEVSAAKPGNVHRGADFDDAGLNDFLASAVAVGPIFEQAPSQRVGQTVLAAVRATQNVTRTNTNLGIVLLLAPLATVKVTEPLRAGVASVLQRLDAQDAEDIYQAIRQAAPGGLQPRDQPIAEHDVAGETPACLLSAMRLASHWDLVARQYDNAFADVLDRALPWLLQLPTEIPLSERIVHLHVWLMSEYPDSLIARKCGQDVAEESAARAAAVIESGPPGSDDYWRSVADLDFWLRSNRQQRNPGTTADLIAATLFAGLRDGLIQPPYR